MLHHGPQRLSSAVPFAALRDKGPISPLALHETAQQLLSRFNVTMRGESVDHIGCVSEPEAMIEVRARSDSIPVVQREQVAAISLPRFLQLPVRQANSHTTLQPLAPLEHGCGFGVAVG